MECMRPTLAHFTYTFTPTPEQTHSCRHTYVHPRTQTPVPVPTVPSAGMSGIDVECLTFSFGCEVDTFAVPTCAPQTQRVDYRRPLSETKICCRESWESQPRSASCCRSYPAPARHRLAHSPAALFIQRHGGRTPFTHREERKQR